MHCTHAFFLFYEKNIVLLKTDFVLRGSEPDNNGFPSCTPAVEPRELIFIAYSNSMFPSTVGFTSYRRLVSLRHMQKLMSLDPEFQMSSCLLVKYMKLCGAKFSCYSAVFYNVRNILVRKLKAELAASLNRKLLIMLLPSFTK